MIQHRYFITLLVFILLSSNVFPHPWKPKHYVIIDTDGGFDDLRAITLMLSSPEIRVLGITTSPGVLSAEDAYYKVKTLLTNTFYHEGIPVGINFTKEVKPKNCLAIKEFNWKNSPVGYNYKYVFADSIVKDILQNCKENITFINLGSLNYAASLSKKMPNHIAKIKSFIWVNKLTKSTDGFNYQLDKDAYQEVLNCGTDLTIIEGCNPPYDTYSDSLIHKISTLHSIYSTDFYSLSLNQNSPFSKKFHDEIAPLYLHFPSLFSKTDSGNFNGFKLKEINPEKFETGVLAILQGTTLERNQVLNSIPSDKSFYLEDVAVIADSAILLYGYEEWQAAVLANEMHRHLGVVATVGVKMGLRAREYFGAGIDEIKVISLAGLTPPLSCMNDGVQVSTGATLGHGLITVDTSIKSIPSAIFSYMGRDLKITLKSEYKKELLAKLKELRFIYTLNSDVYWELVRKYALSCWRNWDRREIFILEEV